MYERLGRHYYQFSCPKYGLNVTLKFINGGLHVKLHEKKVVGAGSVVPDYKLTKSVVVSMEQMQSGGGDYLVSVLSQCAEHLAKDTYLSDPDFKKTHVSSTWAKGVKYICCLIKSTYISDGDFYVETRNENLSVLKITHGLAPGAVIGNWILIDKAGKMHVVSAFDFNVYFQKV